MTPPRTGFGLVDAVVAAGVMAAVAAGLSQLTLMAERSMRAAGDETRALLLAVQKLEQLKALRWTHDLPGPRPASDLSTDLVRDPPGAGGPGLRPGSVGVDEVPAAGDPPGPPGARRFRRRWTVDRLDTPSGDLLRLEVTVTPIAGRPGAADERPLVRVRTLRARH